MLGCSLKIRWLWIVSDGFWVCVVVVLVFSEAIIGEIEIIEYRWNIGRDLDLDK
jgi:hypothetical protein